MIYPALLGPFRFMSNCSKGPSECETKLTSKHFGMGYVKSMVSMVTPLYTCSFRDWGGGGG